MDSIVRKVILPRKLKPMKRLFPLVLLFASCSTRVETPGHKFVTYADASQLSLTMPGVRLEAVGMNHSRHTGTAMRGASQFVSNVGVASFPFSGVPSVVKAAPIIPATIPAFRVGESRP